MAKTTAPDTTGPNSLGTVPTPPADASVVESVGATFKALLPMDTTTTTNGDAAINGVLSTPVGDLLSLTGPAPEPKADLSFPPVALLEPTTEPPPVMDLLLLSVAEVPATKKFDVEPESTKEPEPETKPELDVERMFVVSSTLGAISNCQLVFCRGKGEIHWLCFLGFTVAPMLLVYCQKQSCLLVNRPARFCFNIGDRAGTRARTRA